MSNKKTKGRVYTPNYIVNNILDLCGYEGEGILDKHVIDNSCGDGAFLVEVVRRFCAAANGDIAAQLAEFVHGIEIDAQEHAKCIENVTKAAAEFGVDNVKWDIICADALDVGKYDGKMDFVVGNPPYVRVHNLDNYDAVKSYAFARGGMTDLFIVFYEIGLKMLSKTGRLGYIAPSSVFNSLAGADMRAAIHARRNIHTVVDLKHFQAFDATTYTAIMYLTSEKNDFAEYYEYDGQNRAPCHVARLGYEDFLMPKGHFAFGKKEALGQLKKIMSYSSGDAPFVVKNGFATLCDKFFIGEWDFDEYTIPIIKASTGKMAKCLYPYDENGKLIPYEILTKNAAIRQHYEANEDALKKRSLENGELWWGFGRSQGIKDVVKNKYAINSLIRDGGDIKLQPCPPGMGAYSGLYILTEATFEEVQSILGLDDFTDYIAMLGKYKSGGYYTFSSKDLSQYLNYKYAERNDYENEQLRIF
ncbi:MAG: SAM-dependent methyltransferase [Defluviitaleaceae bacterium]|nr:SAM-dependent methyltransferase [Defluviitaleaceae bacterium]